MREDCLFVPLDEAGTRVQPTWLAGGPWDRGAQHGGPPAALLARAVEGAPAPGPMQVARMTIELLRPVPMTPLDVRTEVIRPGKKVQLVQASLWSDGTEVVRAVALRIRREAVPLPDGLDRGTPPPGPPVHDVPHAPVSPLEGFHSHGAELRTVKGGFGQPGPATVWIRLLHPVVADETPSPLQRVMAAADFGNGVASILDWARYRFLNPDLTVHLVRMPVGEWICLDGWTLPGDDGIGLAECALHDTRGPLGRSLQSLLLEAR